MTTKLTLLALLLSLTGCSGPNLSLPPVISHHHWGDQFNGFALYDDNGMETASFRSARHGAAQACIYSPIISCESFESDQQALNWIAKIYKEHANEPR